MQACLQPGSESRRARLAARRNPRGFRFLVITTGLASIFSVPGGIHAQDRAPAQNPEQYTTTKTWTPSDPRAINDDGVVVGDNLVFYKDRTVQLLGPFGDGGNSALVAVNNRGQVLLVQVSNGAHYFVYDPIRKNLNPIGLNGKVAEGGTIHTVHLVYLTGLDDEGRVYGVYGTPHGPCAVAGAPTMGNPGDKDPPPASLANFSLIGCPGGGDLRIRAVNSKGQITGGVNQQGFLWSDGKLSTFRFPGSQSTEGYAINEAGVVAGVFVPGNRISSDGTVRNHFTPGLGQPQMGFTYDEVQFRLLYLPDEPPIYLTGINNHGQIVGHFNSRGIILDSTLLPIAHMDATPTDLTVAAVTRWQTSTHAGNDGGDPVDHAYKILAEGGSPSAALTLRALQTLRGESPSPSVVGVVNIDAEASGSRGFVVDLLEEEFSVEQRTAKGAEVVVEAVAALAGAQGVADLKAAGDLSAIAGPGPVIPQDATRKTAREKLKSDIDAAILADLKPHSLPVPPADLRDWQPKQSNATQLESLRQVMLEIKERLDNNAAHTFLALELLIIEPAFFDSATASRVIVDRDATEAAVRQLMGHEVMAELVNLQSQGPPGAAEKALRAYAGAPATGDCPGLDALKASGTNQDKDEKAYYERGARDLLSAAAEDIAARKIDAFRVRIAPPAAGLQQNPLTTSASSQPARVPLQASQEVVNRISSPVGGMFYGSDATLRDGILTFTLKTPNDQRNGQTLSFKELKPLPGQGGKAWITQDEDGYVIFSMVGPEGVMGQVLPKAAGQSLYEKAVSAQKKP